MVSNMNPLKETQQAQVLERKHLGTRMSILEQELESCWAFMKRFTTNNKVFIIRLTMGVKFIITFPITKMLGSMQQGGLWCQYDLDHLVGKAFYLHDKYRLFLPFDHPLHCQLILQALDHGLVTPPMLIMQYFTFYDYWIVESVVLMHVHNLYNSNTILMMCGNRIYKIILNLEIDKWKQQRVYTMKYLCAIMIEG